MEQTQSTLPVAARARLFSELQPLRSSKTFRLALLAVAAGLGFWIYGRVTGTGQAQPSSLAAVRLAGGYAGGFLIAFAFRRVTRFALLAAGALLGGLAFLKLTGLFHLDWAAAEHQVRLGVNWTQGQAEHARHWLTGFLPTGFLTGCGLFKGFRCR